jgi:hypothetical protein
LNSNWIGWKLIRESLRMRTLKEGAVVVAEKKKGSKGIPRENREILLGCSGRTTLRREHCGVPHEQLEQLSQCRCPLLNNGSSQN